ncbi:MAG: hypothetical protein COV45_06995 [Deltaproteobacteria bacterium CG11_big_fil_rev_8_21_14_0_20_47_16]|nr:MAG: hypothetical protein COV45_06995 [Deltaproteobacteria bacterium CG11_big_fil_rev_8_21_14_0_20_47_16]
MCFEWWQAIDSQSKTKLAVLQFDNHNASNCRQSLSTRNSLTKLTSAQWIETRLQIIGFQN